MPRRRIGQETMFEAPATRSALDEIAGLIDWTPIDARLAAIHAAPRGEASWPPLAMFRALLLAVWHDLSDVKLADSLDDRATFRRFCGFARTESTPERTAFVRFRRELVRHGLDEALFDEVTAQLKARAVTVKTGTLVDATVVGSASQGDEEARWSGHRSRGAVHGYKSLPRARSGAHVGADADTALVEKVSPSRRATRTAVATARPRFPTIPARSTPTAPIAAGSSRRPSRRRVAHLAWRRPASGRRWIRRRRPKPNVGSRTALLHKSHEGFIL